MKLPLLTFCAMMPYKSNIYSDENGFREETYLNATFELDEMFAQEFDADVWSVTEVRTQYRGRCYTLELRSDTVAPTLRRHAHVPHVRQTPRDGRRQLRQALSLARRDRHGRHRQRVPLVEVRVHPSPHQPLQGADPQRPRHGRRGRPPDQEQEKVHSSALKRPRNGCMVTFSRRILKECRSYDATNTSFVACVGSLFKEKLLQDPDMCVTPVLKVRETAFLDVGSCPTTSSRCRT